MATKKKSTPPGTWDTGGSGKTKQVNQNISKKSTPWFGSLWSGSGGVGSGGGGGSSGSWGGASTNVTKAANSGGKTPSSWWSGLWPGGTGKATAGNITRSSGGGNAPSSGGGGGGSSPAPLQRLGQPRTLADNPADTPYRDVVEASTPWIHPAAQAATTNAPLTAVRPLAVPSPLTSMPAGSRVMDTTTYKGGGSTISYDAPEPSARSQPLTINAGGPQAGGGWKPPTDISAEGVRATLGGQALYRNGRGFRG